jgi:3-hydroxyisobutyrate dehydrogenase-like beta-hydroxyacid dehydrogenase
VRRIGFIGLGNMGKPMARNLLKAGHAVVVHDVVQAPVAELRDLGAEAAASARDVAAGSAVVVTMLPSPDVVEAVALGDGGLRGALAPGSVYIDMSTVGPATIRRIARALGDDGVAVLDAPVSRGQRGAIDGTLSIMVGGDRAAFEGCRDVLGALGTDVVYCGASGMGQVFKLVNNLIQGTITLAVAEGLVLGIKAGADLETLLRVLGASSASNYVLEHFFPAKALRGDLEPGGTVDVVRKDLELGVALGNELGVPTLLASLAHQLYGVAHGRGLGGRDFTAMITLVEDAAGVRVRLRDPGAT